MSSLCIFKFINFQIIDFKSFSMIKCVGYVLHNILPYQYFPTFYNHKYMGRIFTLLTFFTLSEVHAEDQ